MNCEKIDLSVVLTVYNKEKYIYAVYESYASQLASNYEIIFVDDSSTDNSKNILMDIEKIDSRVKVILNSTNNGPSTRLNQGIAKACGTYILLADGDDACRKGALKPLISLMMQYNVKFLFANYGGHRKIFNSYHDLPAYPAQINKFKMVKQPLEHIIRNRQIGMGVMIHKDLLSGGPICDERVFVQDVSLHLNLGKYAKKMIVVNEPFLFGFIDNSDSLSRSNFGQGIYDIIFTYYLFLKDNDNIISQSLKNKIVDKASTAIFKYYRKYSNPPIIDLILVYIFFCQGRLRLYLNHNEHLKKMLNIFKKSNSIRTKDGVDA